MTTPPLSDLARTCPELFDLLFGGEVEAKPPVKARPADPATRLAARPPATTQTTTQTRTPATTPADPPTPTAQPAQTAALVPRTQPGDSLAVTPSPTPSPVEQTVEAPRIPVGAPVMRKLSDVKPEEISWLWPGRIPKGALTLLIGNPGIGKSYLSLDLAARVSTGRAWPDGEPASLGNVLLLSAEDHAGTVIRPRLDNLGANAEHVLVLDGIKTSDSVRPFNLEIDLARLTPALATGTFSLLVIDPLNAYIPGVDIFRDNKVRGVLAPLTALIEKWGLAVLAVMHMTKNTDRAAIHRGLGSVGFVGAARAVIAAAQDPRRRSTEDVSYGVLMPVKTNWGATRPSLAYRITASGLEWDGPVDLDVEETLRGPVPPAHRSAPRRDEAETFLREVLATGPVDVPEIRKAADPRGLAWPTIERAKREIGVVTLPRPGGGWRWALPAHH